MSVTPLSSVPNSGSNPISNDKQHKPLTKETQVALKSIGSAVEKPQIEKKGFTVSLAQLGDLLVQAISRLAMAAFEALKACFIGCCIGSMDEKSVYDPAAEAKKAGEPKLIVVQPQFSKEYPTTI